MWAQRDDSRPKAQEHEVVTLNGRSATEVGEQIGGYLSKYLVRVVNVSAYASRQGNAVTHHAIVVFEREVTRTRR